MRPIGMDVAAIVAGGAAGAGLRWGFVEASNEGSGLGASWGVLAANLVGCLILGCLIGRFAPSDAPWFAGASLGFCGALTTFSATALELAGHLRDGEALAAAGSLTLTIATCAPAFVLGRRWGRVRRSSAHADPMRADDAGTSTPPAQRRNPTVAMPAAAIAVSVLVATLIGGEVAIVTGFVVLAGIGCLTRVGLTRANTRSVPWGTLTANVLASFALGIVSSATSATTVTLTGTAFLGSLSTMSTVVRELVEDIDARRVGPAVTYAVLSLGIGVGAAATGLALG